MAFLRSFGPLGFEIHIFCCNTLCLVYLAWQRARQPISATRDFSVQKPEVSGRISRAVKRKRGAGLEPAPRRNSKRRALRLSYPRDPNIFQPSRMAHKRITMTIAINSAVTRLILSGIPDS